MFKIKVERIVKKPIDEVFEALSDHASYGSFKAVGVAKLVAEGDEERNGVGALRSIQTGPVKFWERITAFEPSYSYAIPNRKSQTDKNATR